MTFDRRLLVCVMLVFIPLCFVLEAAEPQAADGGARATNGETALDRYVNKPDPSYQWNVHSKFTDNGLTTFVIDLKSQTWRREEEVDRTIWEHWLIVTTPPRVTSSTAFLFIGGGRNGRDVPSSTPDQLQRIAMATGTVVAELHAVPNQPLVFHSDGKPRFEDDLIGYTWDQYLKTGDDTWPARLPMVKSVVRAMDTITAFADGEEAGGHAIDKFVVAGGSKRGWTTWMTAAVDSRVVAIVPIVIDVLNTNVSMRHHYAAYGFWAPAIKDYVNHKIPQRMDWDESKRLMRLVDPYFYRDRFTMPKYVVNASGDQFFLPDSSQFYFDDLPGEKYLRYVPNADHSLKGSDALASIVAFYHTILTDTPRPNLSWTFPDNQTIRVQSQDEPENVLLWRATNPTARDFRVDTIGRAYTSSKLADQGEGTYVARVEPPEQGWTAFFVELTYDVGAPAPLKLTTPTVVTPDVLPFKDKKPPTLEDESEEPPSN